MQLVFFSQADKINLCSSEFPLSFPARREEADGRFFSFFFFRFFFPAWAAADGLFSPVVVGDRGLRGPRLIRSPLLFFWGGGGGGGGKNFFFLPSCRSECLFFLLFLLPPGILDAVALFFSPFPLVIEVRIVVLFFFTKCSPLFLPLFVDEEAFFGAGDGGGPLDGQQEAKNLPPLSLFAWIFGCAPAFFLECSFFRG